MKWSRWAGFLVLMVCAQGCVYRSPRGDDDDDDDDDAVSGCDCASDEFCYLGRCEEVFDRSYAFWLDEAVISEVALSGESWDFPGGLPDPWAAILVDGEVVVTTATVDDTLRPGWYEFGDAVLRSGAEVCFEVYDEDVTDHEYIDGGCFQGNDAIVNLVQAGDVERMPLYDGLVELSFGLVPNF